MQRKRWKRGEEGGEKEREGKRKRKMEGGNRVGGGMGRGMGDSGSGVGRDRKDGQTAKNPGVREMPKNQWG